MVEKHVTPCPPRKWRNISWKNVGWKVIHFLFEMVPFLRDIRTFSGVYLEKMWFAGTSWKPLLTRVLIWLWSHPSFSSAWNLDYFGTISPWKVWPRGTWEKNGKQKHINHGIPWDQWDKRNIHLLIHNKNRPFMLRHIPFLPWILWVCFVNVSVLPSVATWSWNQGADKSRNVWIMRVAGS